MKVLTVPCLRDNFAYLIVCEKKNQAGVVDPSEFSPVWKEIQKQGVKLVSILNTHHHFDHVGGNIKLLDKIPGLTVFGHISDRGRIPGQNVFLEEGDPVAIGDLTGEITHNPGHTTGGITYYFEDCAFTGDTLLAAGCGRLFEGDPEIMFKSLNAKIANRPMDTKVYFGHEYTLTNLRFAETMEPGNKAIKDKIRKISRDLSEGAFSTPSTIGEELKTNPFLRCETEEIRRIVKERNGANDLEPVSVFRALRRMKDRF